VLVLILTVQSTEAGVASISNSAEDRGWCWFYLLQCRDQRLVLVLSLPVQRTEASVGSVSNNAEDRG
jgi:hypothetical protein